MGSAYLHALRAQNGSDTRPVRRKEIHLVQARQETLCSVPCYGKSVQLVRGKYLMEFDAEGAAIPKTPLQGQALKRSATLAQIETPALTLVVCPPPAEIISTVREAPQADSRARKIEYIFYPLVLQGDGKSFLSIDVLQQTAKRCLEIAEALKLHSLLFAAYPQWAISVKQTVWLIADAAKKAFHAQRLNSQGAHARLHEVLIFLPDELDSHAVGKSVESFNDAMGYLKNR